MDDSTAIEEPVAMTDSPTPRLEFDGGNSEKEVPQFLKKKTRRTAPAVESEDAYESETKLQSLAEMSIEELKSQQAELERKIKERQQADKQAVVSQISQVLRDYNISLEELVEALGGLKVRRKGTKAKAKYRDPATGTTWSGRGKEPAWIKGAADRTPFEIK